MCIVCATVVSLTAVAVSLVVSGCGSKKPIPEDNGIWDKELPQWIANPSDGLTKDVISAVGMSNKPANLSDANIRLLIVQAEAQARSELATRIQTNVSRLINDGMSSDGGSSFSVVASEVVKDLPLSGATRDKFYQDKNGTVYVRMILNPEPVAKYIKQRYVQEAIKTNATPEQIEKTNKSLDGMFDKLDEKTSAK